MFSYGCALPVQVSLSIDLSALTISFDQTKHVLQVSKYAHDHQIWEIP